jgi:hypothetical protein
VKTLAQYGEKCLRRVYLKIEELSIHRKDKLFQLDQPPEKILIG